MAVKLTIDTSGYNRAIKEWAFEVDKDMATAIREEMGLLVKRCIELTPPAHGRNSQHAAKKMGESRVTKDITGLFPTLKNFASFFRNPALSKRLEELATSGGIDAIEAILKNMASRFDGVYPSVDEEYHERSRWGSRGRVSPTMPKRLVRDARSVVAYVRKKVARVGIIKAGWMAGAVRFGSKGIPSWVSRHGTGGGYAHGQFGPRGGYAEAVNATKGISAQNWEARIVSKAIESRTRDIFSKLSRVVERNAAKWERASRRASR